MIDLLLLSIYFIIYFFLSLFVGLFLTTIALRLPQKQPILAYPTCTHCNETLTYKEIIISFFSLKGKCGHCSAKIPLIYPLGAMITLFTFILIPLLIDSKGELIISYIFFIILLIALLSDLKYQIIPNKLTYTGAIIFLILRLIIHDLPYWNYLLAALIGSGILLLIGIIFKGGIGGGDIKLFFLVGLVLGIEKTLLALFITSVIGSLTGLILIAFGKIKKTEPLPYGPFIYIGSLIAYFFG